MIKTRQRRHRSWRARHRRDGRRRLRRGLDQRRRQVPSRVAVRVDPADAGGRDRRLRDLGPALGARCRQRRDRLRAHARSRVVPAVVPRLLPRPRGRTPLNVYEALAEHGRKYKIVVVATGYNEGSSTMAMSFQNIVQRARELGYKQIVWWTLRSDVDYVAPGSVANHVTFAESNQILRDLLATGAYPDVVLADWNAYMRTSRTGSSPMACTTARSARGRHPTT